MVLFALLAVSACSGASQTTTTTTTTPPTTTTTTSTPSGPTFGSESDLGKTAYAASCTSCHGANGQGVTAPRLIGAGQALAKYNTGKGLLDFISVSMPLTSPGSLTHDQYVSLVCYLLVQNNLVNPATAFSESALPNIALK
jgi:cytochrome c